MMQSVIKVENLCKTFPGTPPTRVLHDLFLEVHPKETVAIMGESGEGKSTLLHILGKLDTPTSGQLVCGAEKIGFVFQDYHLLDDFSVLENVMMPLHIERVPTSVAKERALFLLEKVGLTGKEKQCAKTLSGGEKQRVAIARALCADPKLILADEPTGNLDRVHSETIQSLLLNAAKEFGKALVVVTHDESFARSCDRVLFLNEGQLYTHPK